MSISLGERQEEAQQKIDRFVRRFEPSYRLLAHHAALPLALTPELLNYLRVQFLRGEVPWVAEVDLLLSDLCRQVGYEQYAMDTAVRSCLLQEMKEQEGGEQRMQEVAKLLISYVRYLGKTNTFLSHKELQAQELSAMVYLDDQREDAVRQLAEKIKKAIEKVDKAELARLSRLTKELAPQLSEYSDLVEYADLISELIKNPEQVSTENWQQSDRLSRVLNIELPNPSTIVNDRQNTELISHPTEARKFLWQQGQTKIFSLQTNAPWTIPFDAFVISTSMKVNLRGGLARSFRNFIGENNFDELRRAKNIALNQSNRREITPEYPLIFPLPASINALLNFQDNEQEHFIICSTVELPKAKIKNVAIAAGATLRLIAERDLKRVVLTLFGTGNNPLPIFPVAEIMLSKFAEVLTSLSSHSLEEITLVDRSESTIAAINQVAKKFQNQIVDYSQLTNLLKAGKWKEADEETAKIIIQVSGKKENETLEIQDINNLPCRDLKTLDQLWMRYSQGYFGFSIQREVYQSLGLTGEYKEKLWNIFCDRLGWRENGKWKQYSEFSFDKKASKGSLPVKWRFCFRVLQRHYMAPNLPISSLIERLIICYARSGL